MTDPVVWYTINAQIDGLTTGSTNPLDRIKLLVYQRRLLLNAIRDKAMMMAAIDGQAAQKLMQEYIEMAIPTDPEAARLTEYRFEQTLDAMEKSGPIPLSSFKFGPAIGQPLSDEEGDEP